MKQKTVLVTGGAGYIGSHTAWLLAQKGYKIVVLDSLYQKQPFNHAWATLVQGDYADLDLLNALFAQYRFDAVFHFAAFLSVNDSVHNPLVYYHNNVVKTQILLDCMVAHGCKKLIFSSSCAVYGNPESLPLTEDHTCNPINPYGKTKYIVELMLQDCATAYDFSYVSLRYFNAAGALYAHGLQEWHIPESHIIPLMLRSILTGKPFTIFGTDYATPDGTCIRDYIHVLDLAYAHYKALIHLDRKLPSDFFNLGTGKGVSVLELLAVAQKITGQNITVIRGKKRTGDPAILVADAQKAHTILQWQPVNSGIDNLVQSAWAAEQSGLMHEQYQKQLTHLY